MVQVNWSQSALEDLRHIYDFIAKDSPIHAKLQVEQIENQVDVLSRFPRLGKRITEPSVLSYRELVAEPYRIIYRISDDMKKIGIVSVVHGRRMLFR